MKNRCERPVGPVRRREIPRRRIRSFALTTVAVAAVILVCRWMDGRLVRADFVSGQILAGLVLFLAAFRMRKMFLGVAWLGTASAWMQLHAWSGIAALAIFGLHVGWKIPDGLFERALAITFMLTGTSGLLGLWMTRLIPRRLTQLREQVIYERIPAARRHLAIRANALVRECPGTTLARHYVNSVAAFLHLPRPVGFGLAPSSRGCRKVVSGIRGLDRYLSDAERVVSGQLMQIVREKDDLDYHRAMQGRLKWWIVAHLTLTGALLVLGTVHVALVYFFAGGA